MLFFKNKNTLSSIFSEGAQIYNFLVYFNSAILFSSVIPFSSQSFINKRSSKGIPLNFLTLAFKRSAIKYITGTRNKVRNVANPNPKIMVHESGPQNAVLSPPKNKCGLKSVNNVTKSIFKPTARGI